jgi:hypothetical protein
VHKTSAIGTTDIDAMEFIPLIIGGSDILCNGIYSIDIGEDDMMEWGLFIPSELKDDNKK